MGIGAYQARHIVRLAGGELDVRSEPGAGTTFTVRLPAAV
jgi:signal transduction histidine kinase